MIYFTLSLSVETVLLWMKQWKQLFTLKRYRSFINKQEMYNFTTELLQYKTRVIKTMSKNSLKKIFFGLTGVINKCFQRLQLSKSQKMKDFLKQNLDARGSFFCSLNTTATNSEQLFGTKKLSRALWYLSSECTLYLLMSPKLPKASNFTKKKKLVIIPLRNRYDVHDWCTSPHLRPALWIDPECQGVRQ